MKITKQYLFPEIDTIIYFTPNGRYINFQGIIISEEQFNSNVTVLEYQDAIKEALLSIREDVPTREKIKNIIFKYFEYDEENMKIKSRKREILLPLQCLMYFLRKYTKMTYSEIGKYVGSRHHATVLSTCENAIPSYLSNNKYKEIIQDIDNQIIAVL